jgi:hypothetical protein
VTADPAGREGRRRRREALRRAHPDLGGDPDEFARLTASLTPARDAGGEELRFARRPRGLARVPAWCLARLRRRPTARRVV